MKLIVLVVLALAATCIVPNTHAAEYSWKESQVSVKEDSGPFMVCLLRTGDNSAETVEIATDGISAESGKDFTPFATIGFTSMAAEACGTLQILTDYKVEGNETLTLTVNNPNGTDDSITIVINDNDAEYSWKMPTFSVYENLGKLSVCLIRTGDTTTTKIVQITADMISAISGKDFTPLTSITFSGTAEACGFLQIFDDFVIDDTKTLTLSISDGQDIEIGLQAATVAILDNDSTVGWEKSSYTFSEALSTATVVITKSNNQAITLIVYSSTTGHSATSGEDFKPVSQHVTIPASASSFPLDVHIIDDTHTEPSETFTLNLSLTNGFTSTVLLTLPSTTITITDNDSGTTGPSPDNGLGRGAIIAIVVSATVAVVLVFGAGLVILCIIKRR